MPIATTWNSRCELLPGFSTVKATHPRRILAGAQDVITVRYHVLRILLCMAGERDGRPLPTPATYIS
jgi:hypothetical protein